MKLTDELEQIRRWAKERGLYEKGDIKTQCLKLQEEVGELSVAILKNNRDGFIDAIGDCVVVLTNLAELGNKHFAENCKVCRGNGGWFEDVVGDGGSRMWMNCEECVEYKIEDCINSAFDEIISRKGKMLNGTFVKDGI